MRRLCSSEQHPSIDLDSADYDMGHEKCGLAIIFNHFEFDSKNYKKLKRHGTEKYCERLKNTFKTLDFDVNVNNDRSRGEITKITQDAADMDHRNNDCIAVIVLTHGTKGRLEARDGTYDVDELLEPILNCQTLVGKPKLFFIQACRGVPGDLKGDPGFTAIAQHRVHPLLSSGDMMDIVPDFASQYFKIPSWADLLVMYATYEALCDEFDANGTKEDLLCLLTGVNRKVAFKFQSFVLDNSKLNAMKQMPSMVSMLTKTVKFTVKGMRSGNRAASTD